MSRWRLAVWRFLWPVRARAAKGLQIGDMFPDFSLFDVNGRRHALSDARPLKHAVLWFTNFCEDCQARVPLLDELQSRAGDRFQVLAVSLLGNDQAKVREVAAQTSFPFLLDPDDVVDRKLGLSHPTGACPLHNLFIVDRDGRVAFRHHLSALSPEAFRSACRALQK